MKKTKEENQDNSSRVLDVLPQFSGVAIVDDSMEDVMGLMQFLSKHSIPFEYFDGKRQNFPTEDKKKKLQIIFMDLNINGINDPKMMASGLISNIGSLIPADNGPYCIGFWSENYAANKEIITQAIKQLAKQPEFCFDMEKSIIKTYKENDEIQKNLETSFYSKFDKESIIYFTLLLQNLLGDELLSIMTDIDSKILKDINSDKISTLIKYALTKEYSSELIKDADNETIFKVFIPVFNQLIYSRFTKRLSLEKMYKKITYNKNISTENISEPEYNTEIKIAPPIDVKYPKNVYLIKNTNLNLNDVLKTKDIKNVKFKELAIDISHFCDVFWQKNNYRLFVTGLLLDKTDRINGIKDFILDLGQILYDEKCYRFYVCCNKITSVQENKMNGFGNAIFSINESIYEKIRMNIASMCAKIGI